MKYQIIGAMKMPQQTKNGKKYIGISVVPQQKDDRWSGLMAEQITLWESSLANLDVDTDNGEIFVNDGKKYYIDIDYARNGFINGARVYNG